MPDPKQYRVMLPLEAPGHDPTDAVMGFVEQVNDNGLNNLTYLVVEIDDNGDAVEGTMSSVTKDEVSVYDDGEDSGTGDQPDQAG